MTDRTVADPHELQRFVDAQAPVVDAVRAELAAGHKSSHWMWFVFPQLRGLGSSAMADRYGIASLDEAVAYRAHPLLGPRLVECTRLVLGAGEASALQIFGRPDDLKFRSSMTLFAAADPAEPAFSSALERLFAGECDARTLALLAAR